MMVFVAGISGIFLYFQTDVEKLIGHYPVYDQQFNSYKLVAKRPKDWVSLSDISKIARWAIIVSEDWAYYQHQGLDLNQIKIVIEESIKQKKLVRGASTITQQVVKNTILTPEKTLWRKFREMILAYKLNRLTSKEKVLEIYLNLIELGDGVYGIKKASRYYFNKHPRNLNAREGAFLAMLLPSPIKYGESFRKKKLTSFARSQIEDILIKLRQAKIYQEKDRVEALNTKFNWEAQN
jgi:monofunctional biosynthetic peptidoglycan transglycosylase